MMCARTLFPHRRTIRCGPGGGTFTFRLPGTNAKSFSSGQKASNVRRLLDQYNASFTAPATPIWPRSGVTSATRWGQHDLRVTRTVRVSEKVRLLLIGEGLYGRQWQADSTHFTANHTRANAQSHRT